MPRRIQVFVSGIRGARLCRTSLYPIEYHEVRQHRTLFTGERPHPVPVVAWRLAAKMRDAGQEDPGWRIVGEDRQASVEAGSSRIPLLAAIRGERVGKGIAQFQAVGCNLALAAEQLEDPLGLALADDEHRVDLAYFDR